MFFLTQSAHAITPKGSGKIKKLTIRLFVKDCTGTVYFTDILLQGAQSLLGGLGMYQK